VRRSQRFKPSAAASASTPVQPAAGLSSEVMARSRLGEKALVEGHLYLVERAVRRQTGRVPGHVQRDDLMSAGMAGLAQAARRFNPKRGVSFDHYAARRIHGAVLDELRSADWAGRPLRAKARNLSRLTDSLTAGLGQRPSEAQLAEAAGLSVQSLTRLNAEVYRALVVSYEAILDSRGNGLPWSPAVGEDPEEELLRAERLRCQDIALLALPERLATVIRGYFLEERPVTEIADQLGVAPSRVAQLRTEALGLLRDGMNAQLDPSKVTPPRDRSGQVTRRQAAYRVALTDLTDRQRRPPTRWPVP
jgi:RNA polymerase sigma factor for flagellar operon FliA